MIFFQHCKCDKPISICRELSILYNLLESTSSIFQYNFKLHDGTVFVG